MPKFEVHLSRTIEQSAVFEVEEATEGEAVSAARSMADADDTLWYFDHRTSPEVENVERLDEDE